MKIKHAINLHKGSTLIFILGLMLAYQNFTIGPWVYLSLHGGYGLMWLSKDRIYPDKQWEKEIPVALGIFTFFILCAYWVAPFILISSYSEPSPPLISAAIFLNVFGVFLHYSSDAQKYYTLKYRPGLIAEGFFARCRNTNYLGEIFIYLPFAMLAQHWLPYAILAAFVAGIFVPNMLKKDKSLSRYPEFEEYKANSGLILPQLFSSQPLVSEEQNATSQQ